MTNKRHAKPTTAQLVARMYRHQLKFHSEIRSAVAMVHTRIDGMSVLAAHCERLLREKETLQKQLAEEKASVTPPTLFPFNVYGNGR
jgi:hypothetical protein